MSKMKCLIESRPFGNSYLYQWTFGIWWNAVAVRDMDGVWSRYDGPHREFPMVPDYVTEVSDEEAAMILFEAGG